MTSYEVDCADAAATEAFGERLGRLLRGGEAIELAGDIGAGKTTLVRGLARGLGSPDHVSSPTFVLGKTYHGRLALHHYDLYRLAEPELAVLQLAEIIQEDHGRAVVAIEWADTAAGIVPKQRILIRFELRAGEQRRLRISIPSKLDYITC